MNISAQAFHNLKTHAGVVVRTFPETGFVVGAVGGAVMEDGPEPLPVLAIQ